MASCMHLTQAAKLASPAAFAKVYKDECTLCFRTARCAPGTARSLTEGIDLCLHCFNGSCPRHGRLHFEKSGHSLVLNIQATVEAEDERTAAGADDEEASGESASKVGRVEVRASDGGDALVSSYTIKCLACGDFWPLTISAEGGGEGKGMAIEGLDEGIAQLASVVRTVIGAPSAEKRINVQSWQEQVVICEHTRALSSQPAGSGAAPASAKCAECDRKENLWMCLTCGVLGCGRRQFDGTGGAGHGAAHYEASGASHRAAVKLGTITADGGGDVHCYACDEMRLVPDLGALLAPLGIDLASSAGRNLGRAGEKTMAELQVEENAKFDFASVAADGSRLTVLPRGPARCGIKNLGNSCYFSAVLQSLLPLRPFREAFGCSDEGGWAGHHFATCYKDPAACFRCQAIKVASAMHEPPREEATLGGSSSSSSISPWMFKAVATSGHGDFSGTSQQDASEFLSFFLKSIQRRDPSGASELIDPFSFGLLQRVCCVACGEERIQQQRCTSLSLQVADGLKYGGADLTPLDRLPLLRCIEHFFSPEPVDARCKQCAGTAHTKTMALLDGGPEYLIVTVGRYVMRNWVPTKIDIAFDVPFEGLDLAPYVASERERQRDASGKGGSAMMGSPIGSDDGGGAQGEPLAPFDELSFAQLHSMGFPEAHCRAALAAITSGDVEEAMNWILENGPALTKDGGAGALGANAASDASAAPTVNSPPAEAVQMLVDAGFDGCRAREALLATDLDIERALDWLLARSSGDEPVAVAPCEGGALRQAAASRAPPIYDLASFISHRGSSVHCGHYVAHVLVPRSGETAQPPAEEWVCFNDERILLADPQPPCAGAAEAYIFVYRRRRPAA